MEKRALEHQCVRERFATEDFISDAPQPGGVAETDQETTTTPRAAPRRNDCCGAGARHPKRKKGNFSYEEGGWDLYGPKGTTVFDSYKLLGEPLRRRRA